MAGNSSVVGLETVTFTDNMSFDGTQRGGVMTTDGQLWIGSTTGRHVKLGSITSPLGTLAIGYSSPNITLDITGGGVAVEHLTGNTGGQLNPTANNFNLLGTGSITISGSGSTLTTQITGTTNHSVQVGAGTATLTQLTVGLDGYVLGGNAAADPAFTRTLTSTGSAGEHQFRYTTATSGVTRWLLVDNQSNTAGSGALVQVTAAGSSSGDAWFNASVTNQQYVWGVDNSDSDAFVLCSGDTIGTNNIIRSTSGGIINLPLQPTFQGYLTSSTSNDVTGDGTALFVPFTAENYDVGSNFDVATGIFTAPIAGKYQFSTTVWANNLGAAHNLITMAIVTTDTSYYHQPTIIGATAAQQSASMSTTAMMDQGDTCKVYIAVSGSTKTVGILSGGAADPRTVFSGYLAS